MKKIIVILLLFCSSFAIGQINLATTLRQDSIIKYIKQIVAQGTGTASSNVTVINTVTITQAASTIALTSASATTSGTISAGALALSVLFSSDFVGTFNGISIPAGSVISIQVPGKSQPAIPYTISAGNIIYIKE